MKHLWIHLISLFFRGIFILIFFFIETLTMVCSPICQQPGIHVLFATRRRFSSAIAVPPVLFAVPVSKRLNLHQSETITRVFAECVSDSPFLLKKLQITTLMG